MKKHDKKDFRFPHQTECAIRGIAHGSAACKKLAEFLVEQQRPDFDTQSHLFVEASDEFQKALTWAERAIQKP